MLGQDQGKKQEDSPVHAWINQSTQHSSTPFTNAICLRLSRTHQYDVLAPSPPLASTIRPALNAAPLSTPINCAHGRPARTPRTPHWDACRQQAPQRHGNPVNIDGDNQIPGGRGVGKERWRKRRRRRNSARGSRRFRRATNIVFLACVLSFWLFNVLRPLQRLKHALLKPKMNFLRVSEFQRTDTA